LQLEKKSAELTKAVAQHYLLQKEHAFYKLDNPFEQPKALMAPNGVTKVYSKRNSLGDRRERGGRTNREWRREKLQDRLKRKSEG
jgi:hypothetical protein